MAAKRPAGNLPALTILTAQPSMSLSAKGLAAFLLSRPPRVITYEELFRSHKDAMPFIRSAIAELEAVGMIERVAGRGRGRPRDTSGIVLRTPTAEAG